MKRVDVQPASTHGQGGEIAFRTDAVEAVHAVWVERGYTILQGPTELDFGRSVTMADPDGNRIRAFQPRPDLSRQDPARQG